MLFRKSSLFLYKSATIKISAVTAAVDAAARTAESISGLINKHIIARPTDDSQKMANRTSVGRDKVGHIPNNA